MSNPIKEERGVDRIVGELLCLMPDADEYLEDVQASISNLASHLDDLREAQRLVKVATLAVQADIDLLRDRTLRARDDWQRRKIEIEAGAEDIGIAMPRLGFRIVKPLIGGGEGIA